MEHRSGSNCAVIGLSVLAVAVLEFLAGTAGARLVAADLAPGGGVFRIALGLRAIAVADQPRFMSKRVDADD